MLGGKGKESEGKLKESWRKIVHPMDDEEAREGSDKRVSRGPGGGDDDKLPNGGEVTGRRPDMWYSAIEEDVSNNSTAIQETKNRVTRVDERTAWIARLILMLFSSVVLAVGVGIILSLL